MAIDTARGMYERGEIKSAAEMNVEVIRMTGVHLITARVPNEVRQALNAAVKVGRLGHLKKNGHEPEAYFHPNSKWKAMEERERAKNAILAASRNVLASASLVHNSTVG